MTVFPKTWIALCLPLTVALIDQSAVIQTFNDNPVGAPPSGFTFAALRQPDPGKWLIQKHDAEFVLLHERDAFTGYSLAISDARTTGDLSLAVRLRFLDGVRIGGLVWHYVDDQHYYSLELDLTNNEMALYRIGPGHRVMLERKEKGLELDPKAWLDLKVVHTGDTVDAFVRGVRVFQDQDPQQRWADGPGRVGVIAAGNARVEFDDLSVNTKVIHR